MPAAYEFEGVAAAGGGGGGDGGAFRLSHPKGVIPPATSLEVVLSFTPPAAGNYHRRIIALVAAGDPVWVDVLGTAYTPLSRPFPLRQAHVDAFRLRSGAMRTASPAAVLAAVRAGGDLTCGLAAAWEAEWALSTFRSPSGDRPRGANAVYAELFSAVGAPLTGSDINQHHGDSMHAYLATLDASVIDFGGVGRVGSLEEVGAQPLHLRRVTLTNHSAAKVVVQWALPPAVDRGQGAGAGGKGAALLALAAAASTSAALPWANQTDGAYASLASSLGGGGRGGGGGGGNDGSLLLRPPPPDRQWRVEPECAEVGPHESYTFTVAFFPAREGVHAAAVVEAHVAPKVNRSFRLVDGEALTPPVCLPLRLMGHSFAGGAAEGLRPRLSTSFGGPLRGVRQTLRLPPAVASSSVYYSWALRNEGAVPAAFRLEWEEGEGEGVGRGTTNVTDANVNPFSVHPRAGVVPPGSFVVVSVAFSPSAGAVAAHDAAAGAGAGDGGGGGGVVAGRICYPINFRRELRVVVDGRGDAASSSSSSDFRLSAAATDERIAVTACCDVPRLELIVDDSPSAMATSVTATLAHSATSPATLFIKPTCVGISSTRRCVLRNASAIPLRFEWRVPRALASELTVLPATGDIEGSGEVCV